MPCTLRRASSPAVRQAREYRSLLPAVAWHAPGCNKRAAVTRQEKLTPSWQQAKLEDNVFEPSIDVPGADSTAPRAFAFAGNIPAQARSRTVV
jgi:hypothetical protein